MKIPLYCLAPPPLFQILSNYPNLDSHCSFCCLASLAEWVIVSHLICFFYLMILWIYTYQAQYLNTWRTLLYVLCNKVSSLLLSDKCAFLLVLWSYIINTGLHKLYFLYTRFCVHKTNLGAHQCTWEMLYIESRQAH